MIDKTPREENQDGQTTDISFTKAEKNKLFNIAENSIRSKLFENKKMIPDEKGITEKPQKAVRSICYFKK